MCVCLSLLLQKWSRIVRKVYSFTHIQMLYLYLWVCIRALYEQGCTKNLKCGYALLYFSQRKHKPFWRLKINDFFFFFNISARWLDSIRQQHKSRISLDSYSFTPLGNCYGNFWNYREFWQFSWKLLEVLEKFGKWQFLRISENFWTFWEIYGSFWKCLEISGNFGEFLLIAVSFVNSGKFLSIFTNFGNFWEISDNFRVFLKIPRNCWEFGN